MKRETVKGFVSVIVASYNHARYLPKRMDSLLSQTYQNLEIIVIDDCSPDNSREVLKAYANNSKVTLINRETNGGWVIVSNQGRDLARGEYVIFANCDDYCEPGMIEALVKGMNVSPSIGISFCRSKMVDEEDVIIGDDYTVREKAFREKCKNDTLISSSEMNRFLLHSCVIPNLSAALIRNECFDKKGDFSDSYKACCDWDLFFRIFQSYDAYYVSSALNDFRQHSRTIRSTLKGRIEYEEFIRLLLTQIHSDKSLGSLEKMRFRTYVMKLWIMHLFSFSQQGYKNFTYHLSVIWKYDKSALLFFIPAAISRVIELSVKILRKLYNKKR